MRGHVEGVHEIKTSGTYNSIFLNALIHWFNLETCFIFSQAASELILKTENYSSKLQLASDLKYNPEKLMRRRI